MIGRQVKWTAAASMAVLSLGFAAGCTTGETMPNRPVVRSSGETAPAELQLACAAEAGIQFGVDSDRILPVSSMPAEDDLYQVNLNVDGDQAVCLVEASGTIRSVERV